MVRRLLKIAGYGALALVALAVLAYLARDPLRDALVHTVSARLSQSLNGRLEIGRLRGSLLTTLVLQDIVLQDQHGVVGQLDEIRLVYDLLSLRQGQLTVSRVDIVRPQLTLTQEADGAWNFTRMFPSAPPEDPPAPEPSTSAGGLPFAVALAHLQIRDGQVALRTPSLPGVQTIDGLQLRAHGYMDQEGFGVTLEQFTARTTPANVEIQTLRGAVQGLPGNLRLDELRLQTGETLITVDGMLPGGTEPASLELRMQPLNVAEIGRLLHHDALRGLVHLTLNAEGPPEALEARVHVGTEGGEVTLQSRINTLATPPHYSATLDITRLNLATLLERAALQSDLNLGLRLEGEGFTPGELRGQAQLDIQPSHVGNITLRPSRIDLEVREQQFQVRRFNLDTSVARMTMTGKVDLTDSSNLQYQVSADLAHLQQLVGTDVLGGEVQLQGQVMGTLQAISTRGTLQVNNLLYQENRLQSLQLTYEGAQLGTQPRVTARLLARQAQAGTLPVERLELQATYDGTTRQVQFTTEVRQSSLYDGKTRGTVTLDETGQQVVLDDLQVRLAERTWQAAAPLEVALAKGGVHIKQFRLVHADEALELSGAFEGEQLNDLRLHAEQIDLSYLRRLVPLPDLVGGRATIQVQLAGTLAEPSLQGDLLLQPESSQHLPFERVHTTLAYDHQQFRSDLRIHQANREVLTLHLRLPVDMALTALPLEQRLLDAPVELRLLVERPNLTALSRGLPPLPQLSGTLQGNLDLQGTYTALGLEAKIQLQNLGVQGRIDQLSAPLHLTADLVTAPTLQELRRLVSQGQLTPSLQKLVLRIPTLRGLLPGQDTPPQPVQVQNLLVQADAQWRPEGLQATLHTLQLQADAFGFPRADLVLEAGATPQEVELKRLQVRLPGSEVRGRGTLSMASEQVRFRFDIPRLRLDELVRTLPPEVPLRVQGRLDVQGSLQAPKLVARLQYAGAQITADLAAQLQEVLPRYSATLRIDALDVAQVLPGTQGQVQALLRLQGSGFTGVQRRAQVDLEVDTTGFTLAPGLTTRLRARVEGEALQLEDLRVQSVPAEFQARGTLSAARQVDLAYTLTLDDLKPLQESLGLALQAKGGLTGTVQGPLDALQARATLQLDEWGVADLHGASLRAAFSAANLPTDPQATINVQLADLQGPSLPASSVRLEGQYQASRGAFTVAVTKGPYENTLLAGNVVLQEGQRLTLDQLRLQGYGLTWENNGTVEVVRDVQGTVQLRPLLLRSGNQEIRAQGTLAPEGPVTADVRLHRVQIQPTVHAIAPTAEVPDGQLDLELTLGGTLKQPQLEGQLALTSLQWQKHDLGEVQAQLGVAGQTVRTDLRWQDQTSELLHVHGTLGIGASSALALQVQAPGFDLARLTPLSPDILHSAGTLRLDLHLTGTPKQPQMRGHLDLRDGEVQLVATGEHYKDVQARLRFADERVDIERLHVGSRSGPLQLTGWIERAGMALRQVDLSLQAQEFTAMHTPTMQAQISAAVKVNGSLDDMAVTGKVTVPEARFRLSGQLGGGPAAIEPWELTVAGVYGSGREAASDTEDASAGRRQPAPLPFLRTDVTVDIPRNAWVQGPGMAVELGGNIRVTKDLQAPFVFSGTIETVRGFARFFGKKFTLQEGRVTFPGSSEINPFLDVTTTHEVSDYVVTIQVEGKAKKPTLTLSSSPELEQADIVSLLAFGRTSDRLTSSEQTALSSQASAVAGSLAARQLETAVGETLGLDTVEIKPGADLGTGNVGVGRYVTQDIFLSYERQFGKEEGGDKVGVEYSINRRLKLKGSSSTLGESAVDLFWQYDY